MKLTIDIPEEIVTAIQNGEDYRYDLHTSIAQGIPYDEKPQGDLISREALRKVFSDWHNWNTVIGYGKVVFLDKLLEEIDNAPTVHDTINLYPSGEVIVQETRPKGEWIPQGDGFSWVFKCSCCSWVDGYPFNERHKYCPNCGAKMKGDAE